MSLSVLIAVLSAVNLASAEQPFMLEESPSSCVTWRDGPLFSSDGFNEAPGFEDADGVTRSALTPKGQAQNVYKNTSDRLDYRREIAVRDGTMELTVRFRLYPYHGGGGVSYQFRVPTQGLDGFEYRAVTDRPYRQKVLEGTLEVDMPDGTVAAGMTYLNLKGEAGALSFDFAPQGRGLYCNVRNKGFGGNPWNLSKEGDFFVFSTGLSGYWYGGMITGKVVVRDGEHRYTDAHPVPDDWHYCISPETTLALSARQPLPEGFSALSLEAYEDGSRAGWESVAGLSLEDAVLGKMVSGRTGVLRLNPPPGCYLVTSRFGAEKPLGPFNMTCNGRLVASGLESAAGVVESFTFPVEVDDEGLRLGFDADSTFGVTSVILQRLLTPYEEAYTLTDSIWAVDGVPTPDKPVVPGTPPEGQIAEMLPTEEWRWNMAMTNLGPSNITSRNEVATYADLERRMQEIVSDGYNTVICNGLHFRLCHLSEMPMMTANMQRTCEVAHRYGVRVIEHHDVPILLSHNEGFKTLLDHVDWLQRDVRTGKVATEFCINNPDFRRWYYDWFRDYVKTTDIDGCMLDEVSFFGPEWCGCKHCRAAFTEDTGRVLPYVDSGGIFSNKDDALWVEWEKWRIRSSTDFFKEIRAIFDEVKPTATIMSYTTHYGFTSQYGSRNFGSDLVDRARHIDFLGTEIMSRNVFDSYRAVFGFRKAKAALGLHFNKPIWGLVYHLDDPHIAYFGWALLHMNRQTGWIGGIEGFDLGRFVNWKDKMNVRDAVPLSEVAVVFSRTCCNYNRKASHASSAMGLSQQLSDAHIQHDVILDRDLVADALKRYRLVILADLECLSLDAIRVLDAYVRGGGRLIATRWTSQSDENGIVRERLGLGDLLGVSIEGNPIKGPLTVKPLAGEPFVADASATRIEREETTEVMASIIDEQGQPVAPAITRRSAGKGRAYYCAVPLGALNYLRELTAGNDYEFELNAAARQVLWDTVRDALGEPTRIEAVSVPEQVLVTAYRVPDGYAVHLLNATGVDLKSGDKIPSAKTGEVWPALTDDLVFDLRVPSIAGGRVVSPDYADECMVRIDSSAGVHRVTVPRDALKAYAIVYLNE